MEPSISLKKKVTVPVGKDQAAHLELSREIVRAFNNRYGDTFPEPEAVFTEGSDNIQVIYGTATQGGSGSTEGVQADGTGPNFTQFGSDLSRCQRSQCFSLMR